MKRTALVGLVVVPALVVGLSACDDDAKYEKAGKAACPSPLPSADSAASLPSGFPTVNGEILYMPATQGKTSVVHGLVPGTGSDPTATRDQIVDALTGAGYKIDGKDQEKGKEADADFSGPHEGSISVHPYCSSYLDVKYTINS